MDDFLKKIIDAPISEELKDDHTAETDKQRQEMITAKLIEIMDSEKTPPNLAINPAAAIAQITLLSAYILARERGLDALKELILSSGLKNHIRKDKL